MNPLSFIAVFVIGVCVVALIVLQFLLYRNNIVFQYRMRVLDDPNVSSEQRLENHAKLPEYEAMLYQFWKFNWDDVVGYTPPPYIKKD